MTTLMLIGAILAVAVLYVGLPVFASAYYRLRGVRLVDCPQTPWPTLVALDVKRGALSATTGSGRMRVADCARWPAHRDCGQECLHGITPDMAESSDMLCRRMVGQQRHGR